MAEHTVAIDLGGKEVTISTGKWAKLAGGSAVVQLGGTIVLVASSAAKTAKPGLDFVPLTCDYRERTYAAGKIPGGFFKREGRPTEKETLSSRQIDRPIRPLMHKQWTYETQIMATVVSSDQEHDADVLALIGGSASLEARTSASCSWSDDTTDRKSTRLNSSHVEISYAVFCLKKK